MSKAEPWAAPVRRRYGRALTFFALFLCASVRTNLAAEDPLEAPTQSVNDSSPDQGAVQANSSSSIEKEKEETWGGLHPKRVWFGYYSLYFTTVSISLLLGVLLVLIHMSDVAREKYEPFFGKGQLAQLVVIVVVAGNACSLAIMGLLGSGEISAIYGGIVGYVLGRKLAPQPK